MSGVRSGSSKKILVSVWETSIDLLNRYVVAACLRRDEFLNRVLAHEAMMLVREVQPNSDAARAYVSVQLGMLPRRPVNLNLSAETVQAINRACADVNVPRDVFINRVFMLLVAKRPSFQKLLPGIDWAWATERLLGDYWNYFEPNLHSAIFALQDIVQSDPFRFYRACIDLTNDSILKKPDSDVGMVPTLHSAYIPRDFFSGANSPKSATGFNCFLPDWRIPTAPEDRQVPMSLEDLLGTAAITHHADQSGSEK